MSMIFSSSHFDLTNTFKPIAVACTLDCVGVVFLLDIMMAQYRVMEIDILRSYFIDVFRCDCFLKFSVTRECCVICLNLRRNDRNHNKLSVRGSCCSVENEEDEFMKAKCY